MEQVFFHHRICAKIQEPFLSAKVPDQHQGTGDKQLSPTLVHIDTGFLFQHAWKWPVTVCGTCHYNQHWSHCDLWHQTGLLSRLHCLGTMAELCYFHWSFNGLFNGSQKAEGSIIESNRILRSKWPQNILKSYDERTLFIAVIAQTTLDLVQSEKADFTLSI